MFPIRVSTRLKVVSLCVVVFASGFAGTTHEVQPGDTLSDYAARHKTTVAELVRINGIRNPNHIVVGTALQMPGSGSSDSGTLSTTYRIQIGDTLAGIASRHGTSVSALVQANGIGNKNLIIAGRTITVPGGSGGSSGSGGAAPAPSSGGPGLSGQRHTVQSGETISSIASRYGLSSSDLSAWNGITDGRIYATTSLVLYNPGGVPGAGSSSAAGTHIVRTGETLASIASTYGTSIANIAAANDITNKNLIRVGQKLTIPGGGGSGGIRCPIPGARFFNDWAFPRSGGRTHSGNDMFAGRGTPVYAPVSGRVEQATGTISGLAVRVFDSSGGYWYVAHLDSFGTSGNVSAGTVIGYVGDSGNAKGSSPHGHVEYRTSSGVAVNPYPALRAAC